MGNSTLTREDVEVIHARLLRGDMGAVIARDFAVSQQTISAIRTGESWGWATGVRPDAPRPNSNRGILSRADVLAVDAALRAGVGVADLARQYGVAYQTIYAIRLGTSWAWLTGRPALKQRSR